MAERETLAVKLADGTRFSAFEKLYRQRRNAGLVTYSVLSSPVPATNEKRSDQRRRTRLRSGKILDCADRFLVEATILDRSSGGLRLRLAKDQAIPDYFHFFDDEIEKIFAARVAWRRPALIGACLDSAGPLAANSRKIAALRGKFYAMRD